MLGSAGMLRSLLRGLSALFDGFAQGYGTGRDRVEIVSVGPVTITWPDRVRSGRERMVC